ncbi:hypothetical protein H0X09_03020 [Candidatus Saccharibacteria bacterium]|nr:hypothetical protein [Candidatus Saccharibacteria bacterium]
MAIICPTVTATTDEQYKEQVERVAHFAHRIHIDLTDGKFAPSKLVAPEMAWWPVGIKADFHLMYRDPEAAVKLIAEHQPNLIIVQAESEGDFTAFAKYCRERQVGVGVALLQNTSPETILPAIDYIDHVMIFSGNLGYQGGSRADLKLLNKLSILKRAKPSLETGWDGGVSDQNISELVSGGIDVVNAGGYIQKAQDSAQAYHILERIADETGTT